MTEAAAMFDIRARARETAHLAARRAGVTIRDLHEMDELVEAAALFDETWDVEGKSLLPSNLARALTHAGNLCAGAYVSGSMQGALLAFLGFRDQSLHLHSHVLAVRQPAEHKGIGSALKQHQRAWSLERGVNEVYWTFDPLVRRNAFFNLGKLGAEIVEYHVNFYGEMPDGVNAGDESDRVVIRWRLDSDRATDASEGRNPLPDIKALRARGAAVVLDVNGSGGPAPANGRAPVLLCRVPEDAVSLRRTYPALAHAWRKALRDSMGAALADGYSATAISRDGWYVLERMQR